MTLPPFIRSSFIGGLNRRLDPARIGPNEYALLINGRTRDDIVETIREPLLMSAPGAGTIQGLYAAGGYLGLVRGGKVYLRNYNVSQANFNEVNGLQMDANAARIYAELVPASTLNFARAPATESALGGVSLIGSANASPTAVLLQDGASQPWVIEPDGTARQTQGYAAWSQSAREYVPVGRQMLYHADTGILFLVAKNGVEILRSISGRPLDFMVNMNNAGDKPGPSEDDGGARTVSHRVSYDEVTCLAPLVDPEGAFFAGTLRGGFRVVPRFDRTIFDEPTFLNRTLFPVGPVNQDSFVDVNGNSTLISLRGLRQFNAAATVQNEGRNTPFSAAVLKLFKDLLQTNPCVGKFDDYALFAVQTVYGPGVLVFDETLNQYVSLDLFGGVGQIKQFARVTTPVIDRLFFVTEGDQLYEYYGGTATAYLRLYAGDFCTHDPALDQKPVLLKVVVTNAREEGTLTVKPFVDGQRHLDEFAARIEVVASDPVTPISFPFGDGESDKVQTFVFELGRLRAGWKVGFLLELNCQAEITHVSLLSNREEKRVSAERQAVRHNQLFGRTEDGSAIAPPAPRTVGGGGDGVTGGEEDDGDAEPPGTPDGLEFDSDHAFIEAEDFNVAGTYYPSSPQTGQPFNARGLYAGHGAVLGVDYRYAGTALTAYRHPSIGVGIEAHDDSGHNGTGDRGSFPVSDYKVWGTSVDDWFNYTRNFPSGTYEVWARLANPDPGSELRGELHRVTSSVILPNQKTVKLGDFIGRATKWWCPTNPLIGAPCMELEDAGDGFVFVPLTNGGQRELVTLDGVATLRYVVKHARDNIQYLMLKRADSEPPPDDTPYCDPYVYYNLDAVVNGLATDSTPRLKHLTVVEGSAGNPETDGKINGGYNFRGQPDIAGGAVASRVDADLEFANLDNGFTGRFWIKGTGDHILARGGVGQPGWNIEHSGGVVVFELRNAASQIVGSVASSGGPFIDDGAWHHVVFWWDKVGQKLGIAVDDVAYEEEFTGTFGTTSEPFALNNDVVVGLDAVLDEVCLWKDYVLTAAERTHDYNAGAGRTYPLPCLTVTVEEVDMPLNAAAYEPGRDKIYAVMGGRVFKLNAATGAKEAESRFLAPAMHDTHIDYDSTTDSLWVVARHSFGSVSDASFPIKWLVKINPDTLAATKYSFKSGAGGDGVVAFGDNWFGTQSGPKLIRCNAGRAYLLCFNDGTQQGLETVMVVDLTVTPPSEVSSDIATLGPAANAWGDIHIDGTNLWYCANDEFNSIAGADINTLLTLTDFVELDGVNDRPYSLTRNPSGAIYAVQGTQFVLKGTPAAVPTLRTVIDLGRPNATPFFIKYAAFNQRIYIPLWKDDAVAVLNPADDTFVIKTGFNSPFDVVFTDSKAFAVQHSGEGLKEIV